MRRCVLLIILIASTLHCLAQSSVTANIEPIEMMIGEQATVTLTVQAADDAKVEWPTFQPRQMLVPDVEVLNTQRPSDRTMVITLTSFDVFSFLLYPNTLSKSSVLFSERLRLKRLLTLRKGLPRVPRNKRKPELPKRLVQTV